MKEDFKIFQSIPTIFVDKSLIYQIENYFLNELPKKIELNKEDVSNALKIVLIENKSEECFGSITEFPFEKFPNGTQKIKVILNLENTERLIDKLSLTIYFATSHYYNAITGEVNAQNGKMILQKLTSDLQHIISSKKNFNYIFHPSLLIYTLLLIPTFASFSLNLIYFHELPKTMRSVFLLGCFLSIYLFLMPYLKPYSSFDTALQKKSDIIVNFFILGGATFLLYFLYQLFFDAIFF